MNKTLKLTDLLPGQAGRILKISGQSPFKKRLMEMGLIKGQTIKKVKLAPLADPAEYIIQNTHVSLRADEAQDVILEQLIEIHATHK